MATKIHFPTLPTILMIEEFIRENSPSGELTKTQIWKRLPRKMMYSTFRIALNYLEYSAKIIITNPGGKIVWLPEVNDKEWKKLKRLIWKPKKRD